MVQKETFLTPEGLEKLKAELEHLQSVRRPQVAEQIHRAKELGGTVDNAEYETLNMMMPRTSRPLSRGGFSPWKA